MPSPLVENFPEGPVSIMRISFSAKGKRSNKIYSSCSLAETAFLIDYCDYFTHNPEASVLYQFHHEILEKAH